MDNKNFYDNKTDVKKAHVALVLSILLFFIAHFLYCIGLQLLAKLVHYSMFPVFFYGAYYVNLIIKRGRTRLLEKIRNKEDIITDDLLDDDDDKTNPNKLS